MRKSNKAQIYFQLNMDGQVYTAAISVEELRQYLKDNHVQLDIQENVIIPITFNQKVVDITMKAVDINRLLKQAMLKNTQIIPKSLEGYLEDITQKLSQRPIAPIAKREHEIEKIWFYISQKRRNNVFLTGDMDVGKTALAHEIARQISTNECPKEFYEKHVLLLRPELLLDIKNEHSYERTIRKVMNCLVENRKNIVVYIDNVLFMKVDIYLIKMLHACIKKYHIPIIGTVKSEDYEQYFSEDTSISKFLNEVYVREPRVEELKEIIKPHIALFERRYKVKFTEEAIKYGIYTAALSESPSAQPGNIISIFEKAAREAKRKRKREVDKQSILSCYNTDVKCYENTPEEERRATAYHETGHYIAHVMSEHQKDIKISCVSILPMMWWEGATISYREQKEYAIYSREYFIDEIAILLAGRIAESRITKANTIGASNDLQRTNAVAKAIVMRWGFSLRGDSKNRSYDYEDYFLMPESKKEAIDREVQELIDEGTKRAKQLIADNEGLLKLIAEKLMVEEILTGEELEQICKEYKESQK